MLEVIKETVVVQKANKDEHQHTDESHSHTADVWPERKREANACCLFHFRGSEEGKQRLRMKKRVQEEMERAWIKTQWPREKCVCSSPPLSPCSHGRWRAACGDLWQRPGPEHWASCHYLRPPDRCRLEEKKEGEEGWRDRKRKWIKGHWRQLRCRTVIFFSLWRTREDSSCNILWAC